MNVKKTVTLAKALKDQGGAPIYVFSGGVSILQEIKRCLGYQVDLAARAKAGEEFSANWISGEFFHHNRFDSGQRNK